MEYAPPPSRARKSRLTTAQHTHTSAALRLPCHSDSDGSRLFASSSCCFSVVTHVSVSARSRAISLYTVFCTRMQITSGSSKSKSTDCVARGVRGGHAREVARARGED